MRRFGLLAWAALLLAPSGVRAEGPERREGAPWFVNRTKAWGLEGEGAKHVALPDLDGDGRWDLCLDRRRFFLRTDDGYAAHETGIEYPVVRQVPLTPEGTLDEGKAREAEYVPGALYFADVDNDGDVDALAVVHSSWEHFDGTWKTVEGADPGVRSTVWLGDGAGRFVRGPTEGWAGKDAWGPAMALAVVDTDLDGCLDLFEGREYRRYGVLQGCGVDRLFRGDGRGRFEDVTEAAGLLTVPEPARDDSSRPTYGVTHLDVDGDGFQDLAALSYGRQWNRLWRNQGDGTFVDIGRETGFAGDDITHGRYPAWVGRPAEALFRSNGNTFDLAVGDIDGDGDLDGFLGEIQHAWAGEASDPPSLLVNQGPDVGCRFVRRPVQELLPPRTFRAEHWNYGDLHVGMADFDNDGRLDLLIGSGDYPDGQFLRLYRQRGDGGFDEVTEIAGFDWEGCGGLSLGDIDQDGDVDVVAGRSFMRLNQAHRDQFMGGITVNEVGVFENVVADDNGNHWLVVRLEGGGKGHANGQGIGARVTVQAGGVSQIREIRCGSGLANHQDALEAHFGLGTADTVERLEIRWPDAAHTVQVFEDLAPDRTLLVRQGAAEVSEAP